MKYDNARIVKSENGFDGCIVWEVQNSDTPDKYVYNNFQIIDQDRSVYITEAMANALLEELPYYIVALAACHTVQEEANK